MKNQLKKDFEEFKAEGQYYTENIEFLTNKLNKEDYLRIPQTPKLRSNIPSQEEIEDYLNYKDKYPQILEEYKKEKSQRIELNKAIDELIWEYIFEENNIPEKIQDKVKEFTKNEKQNYNEYYEFVSELSEFINKHK